VVLEGADFGKYENEITSLLCGGTLVFDEIGTVITWSRKPGVLVATNEDASTLEKKEYKQGRTRKEKFLSALKQKIERGQRGSIIGGSKGILGALVLAVIVNKEELKLNFRLSPHLSLAENENKHKRMKRWEVCS